MPLYPPVRTMDRWICPVPGGVGATSQTFTVGRVYMVQFAVQVTCQIDALAYGVGGTAAGSVTGGVLGPISRTADIPDAAAVVAQSASTAQGTINSPQVLTWTAVTLQPGIYYAALEGSDVTGTFIRHNNQPTAPGVVATYDRAGGYGTLTNPTPTSTSTTSNAPALRIRVV
jgi:hypothetical protein